MKGSAMDWHRRITGLCTALAVAVAIGVSSPAAAQDELPTNAMLSDEELASARAGFTLAGLEISLGADMRTYVDGELALHTIVSWVGNQHTTERWVSDALTPADADALGGVLANGHIFMRLNDQPVFLANDGQTALLQRSDGGFQNLVFNTANGVDLVQEADISIGLANFQAFQAAIAPSIFMSGLNDEIAWTSAGATGP
jgi:hypothetical protein